MKNPFGAKITQTQDSSLQPFLVVFDKSHSLESIRNDINYANQRCQQTFYVDQNCKFMMTITDQSQADQIKKLRTVQSVGGINIDFERFQQIITGNI